MRPVPELHHHHRSDKISLETSFSWLSDDVVRFKIEMGVVKKCTKMSIPFQMNFSAHASHATAVVIDDVIIIGRRRVYCAST